MAGKRHNIKAVFLDLDGTLISLRTRTIPDSAYQALEEARRQGILLIAATGRHRLSVAGNRWLGQISFDGYVTMNGQYCFCGDHLVHATPLHREDVALLVPYLRQQPITSIFQEEDRLYMNREDPEIQARQAGVGAPVPVEDIRRALDHDLYQISMYPAAGKPPAILERLRHTTYTQWNSGALDLLSKTAGKWVGIEKMIAHLGLSVGETAAFGDGDNDIEMLRGAGVSVAMGNAPDHVKAVADFVTADVEADGLLTGMRMLLHGLQ